MSDTEDDKVVPIRPTGGHKKRPGGRTPEGKGNGASGIPAQGPGWGGPAKGMDPDHKPKNVGSPPGGYERNPDKFNADLVAHEALEAMVDIMRTSTYEATRLAAAEKVRNQIIGTPISRTIVDRQPIEQNVIDPRRMTPEQRDVMRDVVKLAKSEGEG